jgi:hypothetical protein
MNVESNIPAPGVPVVGTDGRMTPVWFRFFMTLFTRTGGTQGLLADDMEAEISAGTPAVDVGAIYATIYAVEAMAAQAMATGPLLARLDEIDARLDVLGQPAVLPPDLEAQLAAGASIPAAVLTEGSPIGDIQRSTGKFTALNASGAVLLDGTGPQVTFNTGGPVVSSPNATTLAISSDVQVTGAVSGGSLSTTGALSGGSLSIAPTTTTTAPGAGGAGALPATPAGYMTVTVNGTARKIPYY